MGGHRRILVIGFGNPSRGDDGLGPALADAVERLGLPGVTVDADYQLSFEHAAGVGEHDATVLVDAAATGPEPLSFTRLVSDPGIPWSTHGLEPQAMLAVAEGFHGRRLECYLLAIRGYDFEPFSEVLSARAEANLAEAMAFIVPVLRELSSRNDRDATSEDAR